MGAGLVAHVLDGLSNRDITFKSKDFPHRVGEFVLAGLGNLLELGNAAGTDAYLGSSTVEAFGNRGTNTGTGTNKADNLVSERHFKRILFFGFFREVSGSEKEYGLSLLSDIWLFACHIVVFFKKPRICAEFLVHRHRILTVVRNCKIHGRRTSEICISHAKKFDPLEQTNHSTLFFLEFFEF